MNKEEYLFANKNVSDMPKEEIEKAFAELCVEISHLKRSLLDIKEYIEEHTEKLKYEIVIPKIDFNYKELLKIINKALRDDNNG